MGKKRKREDEKKGKGRDKGRSGLSLISRAVTVTEVTKNESSLEKQMLVLRKFGLKLPLGKIPSLASNKCFSIMSEKDFIQIPFPRTP